MKQISSWYNTKGKNIVITNLYRKNYKNNNWVKEHICEKFSQSFQDKISKKKKFMQFIENLGENMKNHLVTL